MTRERTPSFRLVSFALISMAALFLAGCKSELYSNLSEPEANQMMAILMANSIDTDKAAGKDGFTLSVDQSKMLRAIAVLKDAGYPKSSHASIATVFQQSGIMSSPFEERVRYIYALGQEVAETLSHIDGVVTARMNIVLPKRPELGQPVRPSSAAVFIKYQPGVDLDYFVPQIKRLVSSSIEGLDYSAVTVVLDQSSPMKTAAPVDRRKLVEVLPGLSIPRTQQQRFWELAAIAAGVFVVLIGGNLTLAFAWKGRDLLKKKATASPAEPAVEPS